MADLTVEHLAVLESHLRELDNDAASNDVVDTSYDGRKDAHESR